MKYILLLFLFSGSMLGYQNFILIGPPGSGKGTLSSYMIEKAGYKHICPGDIIRTHIKNDTELGKKIKPGFERGQYVDDEIIFGIIKELIEECVNKSIPFIIDGFPRNTTGLEFLITLLQTNKVDSQVKLVHFKIDDATCIERINNRLVCFNCYKVYNLINNKPKQSLMCDTCNTTLEARPGDTLEVSKRRLLHFRTIIEPLIELAAKQGFQVINFESKSSLTDCISFYNALLNI